MVCLHNVLRYVTRVIYRPSRSVYIWWVFQSYERYPRSLHLSRQNFGVTLMSHIIIACRSRAIAGVGFEPTTSRIWALRATNCCHPAIQILLYHLYHKLSSFFSTKFLKFSNFIKSLTNLYLIYNYYTKILILSQLNLKFIWKSSRIIKP